jgi:Leucine-rich repeat (LRR) protein
MKYLMIMIVLFNMSPNRVECQSLIKNIDIVDAVFEADTITSFDKSEFPSIKIRPKNNCVKSLDTLCSMLKDKKDILISIDCINFDSINVFLKLFSDLNIECLYIENFIYKGQSFEYLAKFNQLTELHFIFSTIDFLPIEVCSLNNLISLSLNHTFIKTLPKEITKLTKLTYLGFFDNEINELPLYLSSLTDLYWIDFVCEYNLNIDKIISSLSTLNNIRILIMEECNIKYLPGSIGRLKINGNLSFEKNKLIKIPKEICNIEGLKELNLTLNYLTSIPNELKQKKDIKIITDRNFLLRK